MSIVLSMRLVEVIKMTMVMEWVKDIVKLDIVMEMMLDFLIEAKKNDVRIGGVVVDRGNSLELVVDE
jgi:hypothetical protein